MQYEDLVHQIYNTLDEPQTWGEVLANVCRYLDSTHIFIAARSGIDQQPFAFVEHGFGTEYFSTYQKYFYQIDIWTKALANYSPNEMHASHVVTDDNQFTKSEIYNDFASPVNVRHGMGGLLTDKNSAMVAEVGIMRGREYAVYDEMTLARANSLLRHIQQTLSVAQKIQSLSENSYNFQRMLDVAEEAIFIVENSGRLLQKNSAAERYLERYFFLKVTALHQFIFTDKRAQSQFESQRLELMLQTRVEHEFGFIVRDTDTHFRVQLQPWMHSIITPLGPQKVAAVMLSIKPIKSEIRLNSADLIYMFGFTQAEADVCVNLCKGQGLLEIAGARGVSVGTIRQQVKMCLHKTHTHSQAELVSKLLATSFS